MKKIADAFDGKKAFIAYLMAGDPSLEKSAENILAAQAGGADLIEIGIPFSDPVAEGPVIEAAAARALAAGTQLQDVLTMVASIQDRVHIPLLLMTYCNPVYVYGYAKFFARCAEVGVCGVIIPDLPFEEQAEAQVHARQHGVEMVTLIAPTSQERVAKIASEAEGFIYLVSSLGVTGVRSEITTDLAAIVADIKQHTNTPVAIGFGISTPEQAALYAQVTDGVIVGSAIVQLIEQHGEHAAPHVEKYIASMKSAM
ncbi:MAG: tryptophan synthase subunit alpha [Oscillospiraceae bacterium]|nr:tryptophan synthase subunit alpha [Oscillospiraceae bacterium]